MKLQAAIALRVLVYDKDTGTKVGLTKRQQRALDEFINRRVGQVLTDVTEEAPKLVEALLNVEQS